MMHEGNLYRTTEATACNQVSSRSHAVLQANPNANPNPNRAVTLTLTLTLTLPLP